MAFLPFSNDLSVSSSEDRIVKLFAEFQNAMREEEQRMASKAQDWETRSVKLVNLQSSLISQKQALDEREKALINRINQVDELDKARVEKGSEQMQERLCIEADQKMLMRAYLVLQGILGLTSKPEDLQVTPENVSNSLRTLADTVKNEMDELKKAKAQADSLATLLQRDQERQSQNIHALEANLQETTTQMQELQLVHTKLQQENRSMLEQLKIAGTRNLESASNRETIEDATRALTTVDENRSTLTQSSLDNMGCSSNQVIEFGEGSTHSRQAAQINTFSTGYAEWANPGTDLSPFSLTGRALLHQRKRRRLSTSIASDADDSDRDWNTRQRHLDVKEELPTRPPSFLQPETLQCRSSIDHVEEFIGAPFENEAGELQGFITSNKPQ
ncbi:MAG: hypothetical protein Q9187_006768 [Circinaria calcarea]